MKLFQAVVGIDPSGKRLALAAAGGVLGGAVPPAVIPLRSEREQALFDEAEAALHDFVARNGLAGSSARLCIPAERVYTARAHFPPLRDKDLQAALELELDRLFPFPPSRHLFGWIRRGSAADGKVEVVVVAALAEYIERWQEAVSRAGMTLIGAVPSGWALSAAVSDHGTAERPEVTAVLRETGAGVECTLLSNGTPFHCGFRPCDAESAPAEALSLVEEGLAGAAAPTEAPIRLLAPARLSRECATRGEQAGLALLPDAEFEARSGGPAAWDALGAFGAAAGGTGLDLLRPKKEGIGSRAAGTAAGLLAAVSVLLALAWPGVVAWKAKGEAARLDARIAELRPAVAEVEETLTDLADIEDRIAVLAQAGRGREEALLIVGDLTDRLPQGTWVTGLRIEEKKVEIDGLSPSASEIFSLLTRDGRFRNVEFASPITRQPDNLERFQIRSEFAPSAETKKGREQ